MTKVTVVLLGIILVVAVIAVGSMGSPSARSPGQPRPEATPIAEVKLVPSSVSLDFRAGEMEVRGLLTHAPGVPVPDRVWVWAYFINPTETFDDGRPTGGSRSDEPIELVSPFRAGDSVRVIATGPFHWATNSEAPRNGYYARVSVSAVSAEAARVAVAQRDYRLDGAIPVRTR